jgi:crossover junction endodeoxyribonuclease RuvC
VTELPAAIPRVAGIDLSLTSTGLALVEEGSYLTTTYGTTGHNDATLTERHHRLNRLIHQIITEVFMFHPHLVVLETPAFSRTGGHNHDRSGAWWLLVDAVLRQGLPLLEVRPNLRAKYATGRPGAGKQEVVIAVIRRYPTVEFRTDDEADALILAAIGMRLLDHPIEDSLPQAHLDSLKTLHLPALEVTSAENS